jgi:uncharacterized caspase-like protein
MRSFFNLIVALGVGLAVAAHAQERGITLAAGDKEQRVALVIGNGAYADAPLKNAVNDARDMTQALKELRFEVIHKENLTQNEMKRAIREFGVKLQRGGVGLFYYTGHGFQVDGKNYLVPIGATPNSEEEVEYEAVAAGLAAAQMASARNGLNILILDASRNSPFAQTFRSTSNGLARMTAPEGVLIAYASAPGAVTTERGDATHGVYTEELLRYMREPGLSIEEVFKRVRGAVRNRTQGKQTPWEESSLIGNFYFTEPEPKAPGTAASAASTLHTVISKGLAGGEQKRVSVELDSLSEAKVQAAAAELYSRVHSYKKEDYDAIVAAYREAIRLEPKNATHHYALANALKRKAEWDWLQSARSQDKPRKKAERKKLFFAVLGSMAAGMAAAAIAPGYPQPPLPDWSISRAGLPPYNVGEEIISEFEAAVRLNPRNATYYNDLGMVVFASRNNLNVIGAPAEGHVKAKAEAAFRKAVRLEPNNATFRSNLGRVLNSESKWADAEAEYRKLIGLEPNNAAHRLGLLIALDGQDRWPDAAHVYLELQRLKPDSATKTLLANELDGKPALKQEIKRLKKSKPAS